MALPVDYPIEPMLAKLSRVMPSDDGLIFEPKWDGFRCIAFVDADNAEQPVILQSRNSKPLNRYFPELIEPMLAAFPRRCVVDGEIVIANPEGRGLDFDALGQRIHPAESRVAMLAEQTPSLFIAFDLLALSDDALLDTPFLQRRARLVEATTPNSTVYLTPITTDLDTAREWFHRFEGAGLDGVVAKPSDGTYQPKKRALIKVKHERTADCVVAGYRMHKDGQGVGSLLLGLYDDSGQLHSAGQLHSVGVCATFSASFRAELVELLAPLTVDAVEGHPWQDWIVALQAHQGRRSLGGSRWNANKDTTFVPLRPERVVEVTFGQLEGRRFRHGVKFQRWRPDRDPASCTFDQLEVAEPVAVDELLAQIDLTPPPI